MKIRHYLIITLAVTFLTACQPARTQPVFVSMYGAATPIPFSNTKPRIVATLPGRIRSFSISPDRKTIAFATSQGIVLYGLQSHKHLQTLNEPESVYIEQMVPGGNKNSPSPNLPGVHWIYIVECDS